MQSAQDIALADILARPTRARVLDTPIPIDALPTPALLLDEARFERNVSKMARYLNGRNKGFRPHAKTHKCPLISARQMAAGAVGVCAAKVSEAAVLVHAGISDVLITSPIVSAQKAELIADLARRARVDIVVDSNDGLDVLLDALPAQAQLGVLIDVDVSMGRTGTRSEARMLELATRISDDPRTRFRGIQHYAGQVMHIEGYAARRERSLTLWESVAGSVALLTREGFPCEVVTGAGTGTYNIDSDVEVITDLQVGSYIFMDQEYLLIGGAESERFDDFEVALSVASSAISQPLPTAITVDGGFKAFASDSVNPEPMDLAGARFRFGGDEHGILLLEKGTQQPLLGSVQRFVTPHCDPTVNLYDAYWVHRDGMVHAQWPVAARGCSW
ncbi:MAG: DSD1 family PLP-dependent enzyme [Pseudomonadales bacterium]|nr:DSD1 family PLP-dependent enzyme [Pseudomonadales bacterium]